MAIIEPRAAEWVSFPRTSIALEPGKAHEKADLRATALGASELAFTVENVSDQERLFELSLHSEDPLWDESWFELEPQPVTGTQAVDEHRNGKRQWNIPITKGGTRTVVVRFKVPRLPEARAKIYDLQVQVRPKFGANPEKSKVLQTLQAVVLPFYSWSVTSEPSYRKVGLIFRRRRFKVWVINEGNDWLYLDITKSETPALDATTEVGTLSVPPPEPGQSGARRSFALAARCKLRTIRGPKNTQTIPLTFKRVDAPSVVRAEQGVPQFGIPVAIDRKTSDGASAKIDLPSLVYRPPIPDSWATLWRWVLGSIRSIFFTIIGAVLMVQLAGLMFKGFLSKENVSIQGVVIDEEKAVMIKTPDWWILKKPDVAIRWTDGEGDQRQEKRLAGSPYLKDGSWWLKEVAVPDSASSKGVEKIAKYFDGKRIYVTAAIGIRGFAFPGWRSEEQEIVIGELAEPPAKDEKEVAWNYVEDRVDTLPLLIPETEAARYGKWKVIIETSEKEHQGVFGIRDAASKKPTLFVRGVPPTKTCSFFVKIVPEGKSPISRWFVTYTYQPASESTAGFDESGIGGLENNGPDSGQINPDNQDSNGEQAPDPAATESVVEAVGAAKSTNEIVSAFGENQKVLEVVQLIARIVEADGDIAPEVLGRIKRTKLESVSRAGKEVSVSVDQFDGSMLSANQVDVDNVHDCCVASLWAMAARELGISGKQATALRNYARKGLTKFNQDEFFGIGE